MDSSGLHVGIELLILKGGSSSPASQGVCGFSFSSVIARARWSHMSLFVSFLMKLQVSVGYLMEKNCISPGVTPALLHPARLICFLLELIQWLWVLGWLCSTTSLEPFATKPQHRWCLCKCMCSSGYFTPLWQQRLASSSSPHDT